VAEKTEVEEKKDEGKMKIKVVRTVEKNVNRRK
jgi:hypothetical protein